MLYAIMAKDHPDSTNHRLETSLSHLERLHELRQLQRHLYVAAFASLDEVQEWVENDPYVKANIYCDVLIKPFPKALP